MMRTIAIFARWPEVGLAKTRLVPALTAPLAHALHVAMLRDALDAAAHASADRRTLWWAEAPEDRSEFELPGGFESFEQAPGDLGDRLAGAFEILHDGPDARVIAIGSDCPWLDGRAIDEAFEALERADAVVGPAPDGGFHLIGLARPAPGLFRGIPWSTDQTLDATLLRVRAAGLSVTMLSSLPDVDTPADVLDCVRRAMRGDAGAQHTRAALVAMGLLPGATG